MLDTRSRQELGLLFSLAFGVHDVLREVWHSERAATVVVGCVDGTIRKVRVIVADDGHFSVNPVSMTWAEVKCSLGKEKLGQIPLRTPPALDPETPPAV